MTHLLLKDDLVVNVIVAGAGYAAPDGFEVVPSVEGVTIGWRRNGGGWLPPGGPVDLYAYAAKRRAALLEAHRLDVAGCSVPTDKTTRDTLTAGYVKASANPSYQIADWKVASGQYVTLDATAIIAIADAVEAHVQVMFSLNRIADEAIESGVATTTAHIDSILSGNAP